MLVALDVGNSQLTVGWTEPDADALVIASRTTEPRAITADQLEGVLAGLTALEGRSLGSVVEGITAASVVPDWSVALRAVAERHSIPLLEANADTVPIPIRVDRPAEAGADRLVNAFAAGRLYGTPAIVVDFGTATTLDVVDADGAYIGGAIAAGLELGLEALAARTAQLPRIAYAVPERVIGRDTVSAMQSGAVLGHVGLAQELIRRTRTELASMHRDGTAVTVIATGGLANEPWVHEIAGIDVVDPSLTIRGLLALWAELGPEAGPEPEELRGATTIDARATDARGTDTRATAKAQT